MMVPVVIVHRMAIVMAMVSLAVRVTLVARFSGRSVGLGIVRVMMRVVHTHADGAPNGILQFL
jgi:hypothetical protein